METQRNDRSWTLAGLFILAGIFMFSLCEGYKLKDRREHELVSLTLEANIKHAREVKIAGSFNNWQARCCLQKSQDSDVWSIRLQLAPGVYEYVFIVDGEQWLPEQARGKLQDGLGGRNGVLYVNKSIVRQGGDRV